MQSGFYAPPLSKLNKIILFILLVSFICYSFAVHVLHVPLDLYLGLSLPMVQKGLVYQPFTYILITRGIFELLFNGLLIWFLGYDLENRWQKSGYIKFLIFVILVNALFFLFISFLFAPVVVYPLVGISSLCSSMLLAYAMIFPDREFAFMLIFPIKAKYFVGLLIFMELYFSSFGINKVAPLAQLLTLFATFLYLIFILQEKNLLWSFSKIKVRSNKKRKKHLALVDEDRPKYWH